MAKRGPTSVNLFVLGEAFKGGRDCVPNGFPRVDMPHWRRLLEFGLVEQRGADVCLTQLGREAISTMEAARP